MTRILNGPMHKDLLIVAKPSQSEKGTRPLAEYACRNFMKRVLFVSRRQRHANKING